MRRTTALNNRGHYFKYYNVDDDHQLAVPAWKCSCGKITDLSCSKCSRFLCENHIFTEDGRYLCKECATDYSRVLTGKEKRVIRKARLF